MFTESNTIKSYRFRVLDELGDEKIYGVYAKSFEEACRKEWHHLGNGPRRKTCGEVTLLDKRTASPEEEEEEKHFQFMIAKQEREEIV